MPLSVREEAFKYMSGLNSKGTPPYAFGGIFDRDGKMEVKPITGRECYRPMAGYTGAAAVYTVYTHGHGDLSEAEKLMYIEYLLDESSPWADVVKLQREAMPKAWEPKFILDHGYLMCNLHIPSNWLMDFLMASRLSGEFPSFLPIWYMMVEAGVHPRVSMNFGMRFVRKTPKAANTLYSYADGNNSNHWPFYIYPENFDNFCLGRVVKAALRPNFVDLADYTPVQALWGTHDWGSGNNREWGLDFLRKQHPELLPTLPMPVPAQPKVRPYGLISQKAPEGGPFPPLTKDLLIRLAFAEQKRLEIDSGATDFITRYRSRRNSTEGLPEECQSVCRPDSGHRRRRKDVPTP